MKTLELKDMEVIEGGRFLGIGHHEDIVSGAHSNSNCASGQSVTIHNYYTILWVHAVDQGTSERCLAPNI